MQPPLHREARDKRLLTNAAERDVEGAIKAEYEANGLPMPWDEMAKRILALEAGCSCPNNLDWNVLKQQLASLEEKFFPLPFYDDRPLYERVRNQDKRFTDLEKQLSDIMEGIARHFASLEDRFTALLDQGTAHEKELSAHQTALDCLRADFDLAYLTSLQSLMELVQKQASEIASLEKELAEHEDRLDSHLSDIDDLKESLRILKREFSHDFRD